MSKYNQDILNHYGIEKTAGEKFPVFRKMDGTVSSKEIEAAFMKVHKNAVKGTLKIGRTWSAGHTVATNLEMEPGLTGSVVCDIETGGGKVKVWSYINIDS